MNKTSFIQHNLFKVLLKIFMRLMSQQYKTNTNNITIGLCSALLHLFYCLLHRRGKTYQNKSSCHLHSIAKVHLESH